MVGGALLGWLLWAMPASAQQALVLGGGGSRGLAHAGAITGLELRGWNPELVVGTSIGAIIGALYAAGLPADSIWRVAADQDWREVFQYRALAVAPGQPLSYPLMQLGIGVDRRRYAEGLVADFRVNRLLGSLLFEATTRAAGDFDRLPRAFRAVAADFATGEAVVLAEGDLARAVRASMAVPGVFAPVLWDGRVLVDGGISDHLPVDVARERGYTKVVAVDVVRPRAEDVALDPLRAMVRASRLVLMQAMPRDVEPDVLILPDIDPDLFAAIFPDDPSALLVLGRDAALAAAPQMAHEAERSTYPARIPARITGLRIDAVTEAQREHVRQAFEHTLGEYDAAAIVRASDALYASGMYYGIWPRVVVEEGDTTRATLVVRVDAAPPITVAGGAAYESDRRGRAWVVLRARPQGGPLEALASFLLDEIHAIGTLQLRRTLGGTPSIAVVTGAHLERTDVRLFDGADRVGEVGFERGGGVLGVEWHRIDPDWAAGLWLHGESVGGDEAYDLAIGPRVRIERVPELSRVVGTAPLLEIEARFGDVDYHRARMRGSFDIAIGRLLVGAMADATVSSRQTPLDAQPALGDEHLVPGLAWGRARGPVRVVGGVDVAWPIFLRGHLRVRARMGAIAGGVEDLERQRWLPGAEAGVLWWTPIGRVGVSTGIARGGRPRIDVTIGSLF